MTKARAKPIWLILVLIFAIDVLAQTEEVDSETGSTELLEYEEEDSISLEELIPTFESIAKQCYPEPERVHIEELLLNVENAQMITKCFRFCMMVLYELIDSTTNKVNDESLKEMLGFAFPKRKDQLQTITSTCSEETENIIDHCEYAHKHNMCILREMAANGIEIPQVKQTTEE